MGDLLWVPGEAVRGPVEEKAPPASAVTALQDRYKRPVVSMAVLGDERPTWRPSQYTSALWGCSLTFQYPIVKLLVPGAPHGPGDEHEPLRDGRPGTSHRAGDSPHPRERMGMPRLP